MKLKEYLKIKNLRQYQFAEETKLSTATVSRILHNDGYNPGLAAIKKIVEHTSGQVDYRDFA